MSSDRVVPQLSDPLVRRMADRDHVPREMWAMGGGLLSLHCDACNQPWPCATRQALEAAKRAARGDIPSSGE